MFRSFILLRMLKAMDNFQLLCARPCVRNVATIMTSILQSKRLKFEDEVSCPQAHGYDSGRVKV